MADPQNLAPFHLAFPVHDLTLARAFYGDLLGYREGRSAADWVDFDFYGHQIVAHLGGAGHGDVGTNAVDGHDVPIRHFGVVLTMEDWSAAAARLTDAGVDFVIPPHTRFEGEPGEQATMFFMDPSRNAIELKAFADIRQLFVR